VPIDDEHHWKYTFIFRDSGPLDKQATLRGRADIDSTYHLIRNKGNRYLQDRDEMTSKTFSGLGTINQPQDACVIEGMGPIADRATEHLAPSDIGIATARKLMLKALRDVQEGRDPSHVIRRPEDNRFPDMVVAAGYLPDGMAHRDFWKAEARPLVAAAAR